MSFPKGHYKPAAETIEKIASANRGKKRSPEQRAYMSSRMRGIARPGGRKARQINADGYVLVWDGNKKVIEHRLVMEKMLGRPMLPAPQEQVHHRNGDKADNRPENLELRTGNHGAGATIHCPTCTC